MRRRKVYGEEERSKEPVVDSDPKDSDEVPDSDCSVENEKALQDDEFFFNFGSNVPQDIKYVRKTYYRPRARSFDNIELNDNDKDDDLPENTPEDLLRQKLLKRQNMSPEEFAKEEELKDTEE